MSARFLAQFGVFCAAVLAVIFGLGQLAGPAVVHRWLPYTFGYLALLTLLTYWLTAVLLRRSADNFLGAYFGGMVARLLLSLAFVLGYFLRGGAREGQGTWAFLGGFFALYLLCAGFEIWAILTNLRPFSEKQVSVK